MSNAQELYLDLVAAAQGLARYGVLSRDELEGTAKLLGWERLGEGHFSIVFGRDDHPEVAVKISTRAEDSGAAYAAYCRQNQGMVGIPEIFDIQKVGNFYSVLMRRYYSLDLAPCDWKVSLLDEVLKGARDPDELVSAGFPSMLPLGQTAQAIGKFFYGLASYDLHKDNVMQDEDGNWIITDPVSFSRGQSVDELLGKGAA